MYLCVVGKLSFSIKSIQHVECEKKSDEDQDQDDIQDQDGIPFCQKLPEKPIKLDRAGLGKFITMKSFTTSIHKLV